MFVPLTCYLIFRECKICKRTFKSERGLLQHAGRGGSRSSCHRHQHVKTKTKIIKSIQARKKQAKKTPISKVDLSGWNRSIPSGSQYNSTSKHICLNAISVSTTVWIFQNFLSLRFYVKLKAIFGILEVPRSTFKGSEF